MSDLIIKSDGIKTERFYLPPFELKRGDIVVIFLYNGSHVFDIEMYLKNIFNGSIRHESVIINQELTFVEYIRESAFRRIFYPITVREYLKKNANLENFYAKKIYETDWIDQKTKINNLPGNPRKQLSLYSTLSKTNNIMFDLIGQDPSGAKETYEVIKEEISKGGSAIFFDNFQDMKNDCSKYIEIELFK